jgi:hypothetical protein
MKPRELIIKKNHALIPLSQGKFTIIDIEDVDKVKKYEWTFFKSKHHKYGYVISKKKINNKKKWLLHRYILDIKNPKIYIDHKNGNSLDNRKGNMRLCTHQQNLCNGKKTLNKTSVYKGVCFKKNSKKWYAQITVNGKTKYLGYFYNQLEAAKIYDIKAIEYFGEFALTNKMLGLL